MNIAIIFAGGVGSRMHSKKTPKQFLKVYDKPIIVHTMEYFEKCSEVDAIIAVCLKDWIPYLEELVSIYRLNKVKKVVEGGQTGQLSIYNGLRAAEQIANKQDAVVLIHDAVRPLINDDLIRKNIGTVKKYGSAITTVPLKETVLTVNKEENEIEYLPDRNICRLARAPQSFFLSEILKTHQKAIEDGKISFVDSCTMMKEYGYKLHLIDGPSENIKITTPEDFYIFRAILESRENSQIEEL